MTAVLRTWLAVCCWALTAGFSVLGPAEPVAAVLGANVVLPCSVLIPLPVPELEIQWTKTDTDTVRTVHLFSEGESWPESQDRRYRGRAELFPEEIRSGNYSLRLRNVTVQDAGKYRCAVHTQHESNNTAVELKGVERLIVTGASHPVIAHAGGEVVLNCSVDIHVPVEQLEVEWRKTESSILVHLFSEGDSWPESQHPRYRGRAELFPEEIRSGNYSLKLKDLRTEDQGEYRCIVSTDSGSANATAEVKALGFSGRHICVLLLSFAALGVSLLTCVPTLLHLLNIKSIFDCEMRAGWWWCLVNCIAPCVLLFPAFILWGVIEGFLQEALTCSTIILMRIMLLLKMSPRLHKLPETYCKILKELSISVVHFALITLITAGFFTELIKIHGSSESETVVFNAIMFALISILLFSGIFLKACFYNTTTDVGSLGFFTITSFFDTILALFFGSFKVIVGYVVGMCLACVLLATVSVKIFKCCGTAGPFIQKIAFLILLILTITLSLLYVDDTVENDRGRLGRMCEMAFLFILLSPEAFKHLNIPAVPHTLLYMFGATAVAAVNACALAIELILKAENGQRSVKDLRVVVFPCESIFVGCWLLLQMFANYKEGTNEQRTSPIESMQLNQLDERERPDTDHMTR
ncbi:uncharacterized protein LOC136747517 isoform X2 [Amia ocellicauda]|uniref:uncharacterized protein LOC136747517 isoform X2 n=1 Tax=Amia ocellicauda TaxID=2972642 RepID=UPI003463D97E